LKTALAARQIQLYRDDRCYPGKLVTLSNVAGPVRHEQKDAIMASEGHIFCHVYGKSYGPRIERFVWRNDPDPTYIRVFNVDCAIYPERKAQTDELEQAIRRLPGVSDRPATLPSPDATHD
jgi:hypothetical protein